MVERFLHYLMLIYLSVRWFFNLVGRVGKSDNPTCLVGKTALVTGGNTGIGYALSTLLASRGCRVIIADVVDAEDSKNRIIAITGNQQVTWKKLDLASLSSIRAFAREVNVNEGKIDILINNAGVGVSKTKVTDDKLNKVMQVNFFGPFLLTHLLLDSLKASPEPRVMFASSVQALYSTLTTDNLDTDLNPVDFQEGVCTSWQLYCNSKLCNIFAAQEFGAKLKKYNITVNSADPGAVTTDLFRQGDKFDVWYMKIVRMFRIFEMVLLLVGEDSFGGARTLFYLATCRYLKNETGQNYFRCRRFPKPQILKDREFCRELWRKTESLVKLNPEEKL